MDAIAGHLNYWLIAVLFVVGVYGLAFQDNLLKKLMALNVISVSTIAFFLNLGQKVGAKAPILPGGVKGGEAAAYANPLPHTLMLTAIVVGVATTGVGLAMIYRIFKHYHTLEESEILKGMRE
ncbi:MAG TPA: hypothetical protein DEA73_04530 [Peptococcaceae bacterium]|nr:hypothetical protein [Peptococcaceae bacterium]